MFLLHLAWDYVYHLTNIRMRFAKILKTVQIGANVAHGTLLIWVR